MERLPTRPAAVPAPKKSKKNKKDITLKMPPNLLVTPPLQPTTELEHAILEIQPAPQASPTQQFLQNLETLVKMKETEVMNDKPIHCPFHLQETLTKVKENYYYCPSVGCPVFARDNNKQVVLLVLEQNTNSEIKNQWGMIYCDCGMKPGMRLSNTEQNFHRVFLTCGNADKNNKCKFFQWTHEPLSSRNKLPPHQRYNPRKEAKPLMRLKPTNQRYPEFRPINRYGEEVDMPGDQAVLSIQRQRDRFDKEVQANMDARQKYGLLPYDRETYVKFGSGIF